MAHGYTLMPVRSFIVCAQMDGGCSDALNGLRRPNVRTGRKLTFEFVDAIEGSA
jgi:hypothetical protein